MRKLIFACALTAVALTSGGATDCGKIIDDAGFDVWCGDRLCRWTVEKGAVARAATWHTADTAVELVGADVAISQITEVASSDGTCIAFELVADVDVDAEAFLEVDIFGDGVVDHVERIPTSAWRPVAFYLRMPSFYEGVKFRLTKRGGHAALANVGAVIARDDLCVGAPIEVPAVLPEGIRCTGDDACASGHCVDTDVWPVCAECTSDADCGSGRVCGVTMTTGANRQPWAACVAVGTLTTAAACTDDVECASGFCTDGVCGTCRDDGDCASGACVAARLDVPQSGTQPIVVTGARHCAGGGAPAGGACVVDGDCASGACAGATLGLCRWPVPRWCQDDQECPGYAFGSEPACANVGTLGGTCQ